MSAAIGAVLFDLDGTLLDTAADMTAALNALLAERGAAALPLARVRPYVSHGATALLRLAFPHAPEPEFLALRERYLAIYRDRLAVETRPFDGVAEVLDALEARGLAWGIVTNKPGWLTEPLLEAVGLRRRAGAVVSGDSLPERKPHPRPLLHAAGTLGIEAERCLYVGDAERDVLAARAARMRALVALFGYIGPADDPAGWPADGWIDTPLEILGWLGESSSPHAGPGPARR